MRREEGAGGEEVPLAVLFCFFCFLWECVGGGGDVAIR